MIKKSIIFILCLLAGASFVFIPASYHVRTLNHQFEETFQLDGGLSGFVAKNGAQNRENYLQWSGFWTSLGTANRNRVFLAVVRGRGSIAVAIPRTTPMPFSWNRLANKNLQFMGLHMSRTFPFTHGICGSAYMNMTIEERARHLDWEQSRNAVVHAISAPLGFCFVCFVAFPFYAFMKGPFRQRRRRHRSLCVKCGYNLAGNTTGVCPECGTRFDTRVHDFNLIA